MRAPAVGRALQPGTHRSVEGSRHASWDTDLYSQDGWEQRPGAKAGTVHASSPYIGSIFVQGLLSLSASMPGVVRTANHVM